MVIVFFKPILSQIAPRDTRPKPLQTENRPTTRATHSLPLRSIAKGAAWPIRASPIAVDKTLQTRYFQKVGLFNIKEESISIPTMSAPFALATALGKTKSEGGRTNNL